MKSTVEAVYDSPRARALIERPYRLNWYGRLSLILLFRHVLCSSRLLLFRFRSRLILAKHMLLRQPLHVILISRRLRVVVGKRVADPLDRLFADARNVLKIFWRKIRQLFQCSNTCGFELLDQAWRQARHRFQRRWNGLLKLLHLALDFSALFFFTLNINAPSDQLGCQPDVLSLFANGQRE